MASSGKADRGDTGGRGGTDARRAIFDYETASWRRPELLGGVEEKIGRRLATCDHCCAEQVFAKTRQKPGQFELTADLLRQAARREATGQSQPIEQLGNSVDRREGLTEPALDHLSDARSIGTRQCTAPLILDNIDHFRVAHPAEALDQSLFRNRIAASG